MTGNVRCFNDSNGDRDCHLCARLGGCEHFGKNPVAWGPPPKCVILDEAVWDKELSDAVLSDNWDFDPAQHGKKSFTVLSRFDVPITDPRRNIVLGNKEQIQND